MLDLQEDQVVALIGTVYKDMKMKPSILDEYTKVRASHGSPASRYEDFSQLRVAGGNRAAAVASVPASRPREGEGTAAGLELPAR